MLLEPLAMLVGLAAKEVMDGMEDPAGGFEVVEAPPHPDRSAHSAKKSSGWPRESGKASSACSEQS